MIQLKFKTQKYLLCLFLLIVIQTTYAQIVTGNIEEQRIQRITDGFLVYGFTGNKDDLTFNVIKYNNNLEIVKEYKKQIFNNVKQNYVGYLTINDLFIFYFIDKGLKPKGGAYLRLDKGINEVSYFQYKNEDFPSNSSYNYLSYYIDNGRMYTTTQVTSHNSIFEGRCTEDEALYLMSYKMSSQTFLVYDLQWKTQLKNNGVIRQYLFPDDKFLFILVSYYAKKSYDTQYVYCINKKTGEIISETELILNDGKLMDGSKIYWDDQKKEILAVGNYIIPDNSIKIKNRKCGGFAAAQINANGKITSNKLYNYPDYNVKEPHNRVSSSFNIACDFDFSDSFIVIDSIIKSDNGNIKIITTNKSLNHSLATEPNEKIFVTMGFTFIELKPDLELANIHFMLNEKFKELNHIDYSEMVYDSKNNEFTMMYLDRKVNSPESNPETNIYFNLKSSGNDEIKNMEIPNQTDAKKDSQCFLRDRNSSFVFTPLKEGEYKLEIVK